MANNNELLKRILVAVIAIPVLLFIFWLGGPYFAGLIGVISIIGYYEFLSKTLKSNSKIVLISALVFSALFQTIIVSAIPVRSLPADYSVIMRLISSIPILMFVILISIYFLFNVIMFISSVRENLTNDFSMVILGFFYTQILFSIITFLRDGYSKEGFLIVLFIFIMIWINDSAAYFGGMLFGKRKLSPKLSPKKTIEGFVTTLIVTPVFGLIFFYIFKFPVNIFQTVILSLIVSVFGMLGDLFESGMKRSLGIKDFGSILPGHGGILDRFDSVLLVSAVIFIGYYFPKWLNYPI
ncbi:MAG: phosphatidate cytidylyltransferase [bacterium]|nr:phosphatidate cytidylyltransferase [bacterium]